MTNPSRARQGLTLTLVGSLILAAGLVAGTWFERYYGPGGLYLTLEDALADHHALSKVSREAIQDACLSSMAQSVGDVHTEYVPRVRQVETMAGPKTVPTVRPEPPKPVVTVQDLDLPDRRVAVIRLEHFIEEAQVPKLFWAKVASERLADRDGLIVDLRGNRGGRILDAVEIASAWIGQRRACTLEDRDGRLAATYDGPAAAVLAAVPTALLVNASTASSAEIFAGALQDYGVARLFGSLTFGKGVSTKPNDLGNGRTFIYADHRWFTPLHRSVHGLGLVPDEIVPEPANNDCHEGVTDDVLDRAVAWLRTKPRRQ